MWLYVPSVSAQESEALTSESNSPAQASGLYVTSSGTPTLRPSSWHGWKKRPWIELLSGATYSISQMSSMAERWTSSLEASPVNHTQEPAKGWVLRMSETFGQQLFDFSDESEPGFSSSRMSQDSQAIQTDCQESRPTLPRWGGMQSGECFPTAAWVARKADLDCSFWPTPTAQSYGTQKSLGPGAAKRPGLEVLSKNWATPTSSQGGRSNPPGTSTTGKRPDGKKAQIDLNNQARNWPTPRANQQQGGDRQKDGSITPNLLATAKNWPTPNARDSKGANGANAEYQCLSKDAKAWPTPTSNNKTRPNNGTGISLDQMGKNWPTPKTRDYHDGSQANRDNPDIPFLVKDWPTPAARDWKAHGPSAFNRKSPNLPTACLSGLQDKTPDSGEESLLSSIPQHLNTQFVEWLMGFPIGWSSPTSIALTDFDAWEMQSAHMLRQWLGLSSSAESSRGKAS